ncbi:MAG: glycosyltransferase family 2 protein [Bacteroidales bacterium]|nr:glycosyltransferase family 2 protein [Bacteroidales bacterium]
MDVSIIIVNYNTKELLRNCIQSIYNHKTQSSYEIIVVDNNSHDGSCEMIKSEFTKVKLIESSENLGFGRANNLGLKHASGSYFFFLNSDTVLLNNAIDYFVEFCAQRKELKIGAVGSILIDSDNRNMHSYGTFITIKSLLLDILYKYKGIFRKAEVLNDIYLHPESVSSPICVEYITGADLFVPAMVVDDIGDFDPRFFMYCEEVDWQKRMCDSGYGRFIIPGPKIIHLEGASAPSTSRHRSIGRILNTFVSQIQYIAKHMSRGKYLLFRICFASLWILPICFRADSFKDKLRVIKVLFAPVQQ